MVLISLVFFLARKEIGRIQAHILLAVFRVGQDKQPEIAAGLASAWMALAILIFAGGIVIALASLLAV
jgi:hypothetical protein